MRQLITRVDDALLEKVKARARAEGLSVNAFVNRLLAEAADQDDRRRRIERRLDEMGLRVHVERPRNAPSQAEIDAIGRALGTSVSEALEWSRGDRPE
jgi:hypothetical protein